MKALETIYTTPLSYINELIDKIRYLCRVFKEQRHLT